MNPSAAAPGAMDELPWHREPLMRMRSAWQSDRLPHALLLHGADGLGKSHFATWLARAVLCDEVQIPLAPCGRCTSCTLAAAGTHPDLALVAPAPDKQSISIEQIREVGEKLALTSFRHGRKVAIIEPAHRMTIPAANSVLKTLEEPPSGSLLMLVTSQPSSLPATIRSRCLKLGFRAPQVDDALAWLRAVAGVEVEPGMLEFVGGAPLAALAVADGEFADLDRRMRHSLEELLAGRVDVSTLASGWTADLEARLRWLEFWCAARIRARFAESADQVTLRSGAAPLPTEHRALNISSLYGLLDAIRELRLAMSRTALQKELAIESLLIHLVRSLAPPARDRTGHR